MCTFYKNFRIRRILFFKMQVSEYVFHNIFNVKITAEFQIMIVKTDNLFILELSRVHMSLLALTFKSAIKTIFSGKV